MYNGIEHIRSWQEEVNYTQEQVLELLKCSEDIHYFAENYFHIVTLDRGKVLIELYDFQRDLLDLLTGKSIKDDKYNAIVLSARQSSKCVCKSTKINIRNKKTGETKEVSIEEFHEMIKQNNLPTPTYSENPKFIENFDVSDWEVESESGYVPIISTNKTIPYRKWIVKTETHELECADNHIVIDHNHKEIYVKDLTTNDILITKKGLEKVISIKCTDEIDNCYDLSVDSDDHTYFTNNILSHNTTTITIFALWYAMFHKDKVIYVLANKQESAIEILDRVKCAYEMMPYWFQIGVSDYSQKSITFGNRSKIKVAGTSASSIRGRSCNCVGPDSNVTVKDKKTGKIEKITIEKLYERLGKNK